MSGAKVVIADARVDVVIQEPAVTVELGNSGPQGPPGPRGSQFLSGDTDPTINVGLVGDQYLNTETMVLFGPKTTSGWGDGYPIIESDDLGQVFTQITPSATWNIVYTLDFVPNVTIVDSENRVVEGAYEYFENSKTIVAEFNESISGKAYLS
jgi:hypothetical protein